MKSIDEPAIHYDRVTNAWRFLLGENFHCGCFLNDNDSLEMATDNLTTLMAITGSVGPNMSVLDVGCGIGSPACLLAERYGCRVSGISTSTAGIAQATQRVKERGCADKVFFAMADGMNNGLPAASFDRVWVL